MLARIRVKSKVHEVLGVLRQKEFPAAVMAKGLSWRVRPAAEDLNLPARWCAGARDGLDHPAAGPSKVLLSRCGHGGCTDPTAGSETLRTDDGTLPGCRCACWVARAWPGRELPLRRGDWNTVRRPARARGCGYCVCPGKGYQGLPAGWQIPLHRCLATWVAIIQPPPAPR